jgi:hypothetical protein
MEWLAFVNMVVTIGFHKRRAYVDQLSNCILFKKALSHADLSQW